MTSFLKEKYNKEVIAEAEGKIRREEHYGCAKDFEGVSQ